jgi:hypothetical protein
VRSLHDGRDDFIKAKDLNEDMMVNPNPAAEDEDDVFTAAGACGDPIDMELKVNVDRVRAVTIALHPTRPNSLSWWEAKKQGSAYRSSRLHEPELYHAVHDAVQGHLQPPCPQVDDRRGALDDNHATALRLSAATAKLECMKLTKHTAGISSIDSDDKDVLEG